jgi:hypothetical protein
MGSIRGFAAVLGRELFERRLLLLMAILLGLVPFLLPLLPGQAPQHADELRGGTALGLALALSLALSVLLGASVIAGDLAHGRLGFYFARPLRGGTIWAGKLAAALLLVALSTALVLLPSRLLGDPQQLDALPWLQLFLWGAPNTSLWWLWAPWTVFLLLASHVAAVAVRSRSLWLMLDVAGVALVAGLLASAVRLLTLAGVLAPIGLPNDWSAGGLTALGWLLVGSASAILVALLVAGAVQVAGGRIDARRGHRLQSLTLWALLGASSLGALAYSRWVVSARPGDLLGVFGLRVAPRGSWVAFYGPAARRPGYLPGFFVDTASGRFVRARFGLLGRLARMTLDFTADGRRAAWLEYADRPFLSPLQLMTLDLTTPGSRPRPTLLAYPGQGYPPEGWPFALSPDGRRFALVRDERLTVEEVANGRLLAAVLLPGESFWARRLSFDGADRIEIDQINNSPWWRSSPLGLPLQVDLLRLDLTSGRLERHGSAQPTGFESGAWVHRPGDDRALILGRDAVEVHDGSTGDLLGTVAAHTYQALLVPRGLVVAEKRPEGRLLRLFDRDGRQERARFSLPGVHWLAYGEITGEGSLQIVARPAAGKARRPEGKDALLRRWQIDLATATLRPLPAVRLVSLGTWDGDGGTPLRQGAGALWVDDESRSVRFFLMSRR